jgi:hypothetical protein
MSTFDCRFCQEEFTNRTDVICPCKCSGSQKYVCKECLNKYMGTVSPDIKYTTCPTCKANYVREGRNYGDSQHNDDVRDEVLMGIGFLLLITVMFLVLGLNEVFFLFLILVIYFYTISAFTILIGNSRYVTLVVLLFCIIMSMESKYAYPVLALWVTYVFAALSYRLITVKWCELLNRKLSRIAQTRMFDFDLSRYVNGVL